MFRVRPFLPPNLHQIVPTQDSAGQIDYIFGHHLSASRIPTIVVLRWDVGFRPHNLQVCVEEASDRVQNFCFAPKAFLQYCGKEGRQQWQQNS